ncbi:MAG TPA: FAD-binding protein [Chthoniobacteraceae bacterium]|jgi:glycolate oxidase FAD binding subunit|nr:FAD-binding protein [Chthoniobacteraceae bacterium]
MSAVLAPESVTELVDAVRSTPRLLAIGAGTKPRLSAVETVKLSTARLRGISEYDPSEFTFTAAAGTPVREIAAALAERGQYLPFDPMLVDAGSTLGGTVAAGLSGPGRFRFGGLRDFILGVRFVDGAGRLLRMGGKVVKNAAGFDLPKFFVGSLGRFGVLADLTFKVFPRPASSLTLRLAAGTLETALKILTEAAGSRFEFDALDVAPDEPGVLARLAGPASALPALAREVFARWPGEVLTEDFAESIWGNLREFRWAHPNTPLVKIGVSPATATALGHAVRSMGGARWHLSAGGNLAFVSLASTAQTGELNERLRKLELAGVMMRGEGPLWLGFGSHRVIDQAVKEALDPMKRFPSLYADRPFS